jgi:uncharacterized repeat protein (TIGR02543 family)
MANNVISFNADGGAFDGGNDTINMSSVLFGDMLGSFMPEPPVRLGFVFAGWTATGSDGMILNFDETTPITGDLTISAVWSVVMQSVMFYDADGNSEVINVEYGGGVTLPTQPARSGYAFTGWNTASDGSGVAFDSSMAITSDMVLFSQWVPLCSEVDCYGIKLDGKCNEISCPSYLAFCEELGCSARVGADGKCKDALCVSNQSGNDDDSGDNPPGSEEPSNPPETPETETEPTNPPDNPETPETNTPPSLPGNNNTGLGFGSFGTGNGSDNTGNGMVTGTGTTSGTVTQTGELDYIFFSGGDDDEHWLSGIFETIDHIRYIHGYSDGTVRPDGNITRAEIAMMFFRLLQDPYKESVLRSPFSDVSNSSWYGQAVSYLHDIGILHGFPDGTFSPDQAITRAEFTAIATRFLLLIGYEEAEHEYNPYIDLGADHWAYDYILLAYKYGWVNGVDGDLFSPDRKVTRGEAATVINIMLGRNLQTADVPLELHSLYRDLTPEHRFFAAIIEASVEHTYERREDNSEVWTQYGPT